MSRKRPRTYSIEFQRAAVARLKECESVIDLATELGINRQLLYKWRDRLAQLDGSAPEVNARDVRLLNENKRLKQALANKTLEVDFFRGALQRIEVRRQQLERAGEKASTTKSGE